MISRLAAAGRALLLPLLSFLLWEVLARTHHLPEAASRPTTILRALALQLGDGSLLGLTAQTLVSAAGGWALGALLAIAVGVAIGTVPPLRATLGPTINLMRSVPPVALIPVALLAFGLGPKLEITMVAFAVFWPVVILTAAGVESIDSRLLEVGRALRFSRRERILRFVLPAASPSIAVGLRLGAGIALVIAVTTEIIASPAGLGNGIAFASSTLRPDLMFADLFWLAFVGFTINAAIVAVEFRAFAWARR